MRQDRHVSWTPGCPAMARCRRFPLPRAGFYRHLAPELRMRTGARPTPFHSDTSPLLTHTFFLLEGTGDVTAVAGGCPHPRRSACPFSVRKPDATQPSGALGAARLV